MNVRYVKAEPLEALKNEGGDTLNSEKQRGLNLEIDLVNPLKAGLPLRLLLP